MSEAPPFKAGSLTLAIIGAGKAGRSLAAHAVRAGHHVVLEDVLPSKLRSALEEIETEHQPDSLSLAQTVEDAVREADLVVDFVPDELESKLEIISMIDRMAPPKTMMCVPTRALSISDLAACTYRAERCIGAQISAESINLIVATRTSQETIACVQQFWESVGYKVEVLQEALMTS